MNIGEADEITGMTIGTNPILEVSDRVLHNKHPGVFLHKIGLMSSQTRETGRGGWI